MTTIDFKVKSQTGHMKILTTQYLENPFHEVKGLTAHKKVMTAQCLDNPFLNGHQILYTSTS